MNQKQEFLFYVMQNLRNHPEWMGEVVEAMQAGVNMRLEKEINEKVNLAYALVSFVQNDSKRKFPYYENIQPGLTTLKKFFAGAEVEKEIESLIINE